MGASILFIEESSVKLTPVREVNLLLQRSGTDGIGRCGLRWLLETGIRYQVVADVRNLVRVYHSTHDVLRAVTSCEARSDTS